VADERAHHDVYPPCDEVFAAFALTSYADTKVVILGQDPYHGAGQAHGLAFSVRRGVVKPAIAQEHPRRATQDLEHEGIEIQIPEHGKLEQWACNGVCCSIRH
jgi:uracil DNA glycosylase